MHNIYLEGEWNTDTGWSGKQQTMRGKTRTTINEKTAMARVTACCWGRTLQKLSDEGRHGLPEATKTTLVTGNTEHFSWEYHDGHGIPAASDFLFQTLRLHLRLSGREPVQSSSERDTKPSTGRRKPWCTARVLPMPSFTFQSAGPHPTQALLLRNPSVTNRMQT